MDMRGEVALLTRNVVIEGQDSGSQFGGQTKVNSLFYSDCQSYQEYCDPISSCTVYKTLLHQIFGANAFFKETISNKAELLTELITNY